MLHKGLVTTGGMLVVALTNALVSVACYVGRARLQDM